jgi:hypothetical protein
MSTHSRHPTGISDAGPARNGPQGYVTPAEQLRRLEEEQAREAEWAAEGDETEVNPFSGGEDVTHAGPPAIPVPILLAWLAARMPRDEALAIVASLVEYATGGRV